MSYTLSAATAAIAETREGLASSGYSIDVSDRDGRLMFSVRAGDGACAECLVPRPIFETILRRELAEGGVQVDSFDLLYPLDDAGPP